MKQKLRDAISSREEYVEETEGGVVGSSLLAMVRDGERRGPKQGLEIASVVEDVCRFVYPTRWMLKESNIQMHLVEIF